jgi:ubiquinone biosynthesis O-methyltransferase
MNPKGVMKREDMKSLINMARMEFNEQRYRRERFIKELPKTVMFRVELILKFVGHRRKVLDVGCCNGLISELIARNDNEVYGVDISENVLEAARSRGIKAYKVDLECEELPFPANYFDVVVASEVVEHLFNTDNFLRKIKHVLKNEGKLIITTPNLASLGRRLLLLLGKNPLMEVSINEDTAGHLRYFVKETMVELLEKHGFKIDRFTSDVVNFNKSGRLYSIKLARIFPAIGRTLIFRAENSKRNEE